VLRKIYASDEPLGSQMLDPLSPICGWQIRLTGQKDITAGWIQTARSKDGDLEEYPGFGLASITEFRVDEKDNRQGMR